MRTCKRCSAELAEGQTFCAACGEDNRAVAPPEPLDIRAAERAIAEMNRLGAELTPGRIQELTAATEAVPELRAEMAALTARIAESEQAIVAAQRIRTATVDERSPDVIEERTGGFSTCRDFLQAVLTRDDAEGRLGRLQTRALSMGVGAAGGFLVPPQFAEMLTSISPQDAIVRPRANVIPAGTPPDAPITMPADDQSGANGVYSGVTVKWVGEGDTKPDTQPILRELTLTPHEVTASVEITDKLLRNAPAAAAWVESKLRGAILAAEDVAFITGNGVGQPLGFLGHASAINVARAGAGAIAYADVVNMYAQLLTRGVGSPVWIGNPTVLPQLQAMASVLGQLIWQPSAREGEPSTLLGIPFMRNERQPVLGANGDLMLVNLQYYLIKDGSPLSISDDGGIVNFKYNKTIVKAFWNVDGQPSLTTPLLLEDGATTQSPFVVLL